MSVLLVEDDESIAIVITAALEAEGFTVTRCDSVAERDRLLAQGRFSALVTDVILTDGDGIETLGRVRDAAPDMPVIILSAQNTLDTAVRASDTGAFEYFPKPFDIDELARTVRQAVGASKSRAREGEEVPVAGLPLVGRSAPMQAVYRMITRVLRNDLTVLVLGESGTGKELVAEAIHQLGHRKDGPFVAVNTAAIPAELIESELFGHEKGSFTGAVGRRLGKFELASGGTIFLDEICDMSASAQAKVLRVLQEQQFERVGGSETITVDVRVISATNIDPLKAIEDGRFREDLFYRLNVIPIRVPPLSERREDIPLLAGYFFDRFLKEHGLGSKEISEDGMRFLSGHSWPGNIRELKNVIERVSIMVQKEVVDAEDIRQNLEPRQAREPAETGDISPLKSAREDFERRHIIRALIANDKNVTLTAKELGIERTNLHRKIKQFDIDLDRLDP